MKYFKKVTSEFLTRARPHSNIFVHLDIQHIYKRWCLTYEKLNSSTGSSTESPPAIDEYVAFDFSSSSTE